MPAFLPKLLVFAMIQKGVPPSFFPLFFLFLLSIFPCLLHSYMCPHMHISGGQRKHYGGVMGGEYLSLGCLSETHWFIWSANSFTLWAPPPFVFWRQGLTVQPWLVWGSCSPPASASEHSGYRHSHPAWCLSFILLKSGLDQRSWVTCFPHTGNR